MSGFHSLAQRLGAVAIALTAMIAPLAVPAQDLPSYARPAYVSTDETIHGRISSVDGAFTISVADDRGFVDNVQLHQGTIINPTGLTLSPGMSVTIQGVNAGSTFNANEIDTPYTYAGPLPTPVYYGPGYWCPGFGYGYGPSFSLAIVIGGGDRPWYFEHRRFYGRPWDGHGYFGGYIGRGQETRGRFERQRSFSDPSMRAETSVRSALHAPAAHMPSAFAGRSFAGETRINGDRRAESSSRQAPAVQRTLPIESRNSYSGEVESRGPLAGGNYGRGPASASGHAPAGNAAAPSRGGGGSRSGGGAGGGRAH